MGDCARAGRDGDDDDSGLAGKARENELSQLLREYRTNIERFLRRTDPQSARFRADGLVQNTESIVIAYQPLKRAVLVAGASEQVRISELAMLLEYIRGLRQITEQTAKGTRDILELLAATGSPGEALAAPPLPPASGGEKREQLAQTVGHDLHGDGGKDQAEQPAQDIDADRPEAGTDRGGEAQNRPK